MNLLNHKVYIGITRRKHPQERWGKNGSRYDYNEHFYRAIQKYGWEQGFSHDILYSGLTYDEATTKEIELIAFYNSFDPEYGYNNDKGGNGSNRILSSTIEKIRAVHIGSKQSDETCCKISKSLIGHKVTAETRKKISENSKKTSEERSNQMKKSWLDGSLGQAWNKGVKFSQEQIDDMYQHRYRPVRCIDSGKEYKSVKAASIDLGLQESCIRAVCDGKRKSTGGMHFEDI